MLHGALRKIMAQFEKTDAVVCLSGKNNTKTMQKNWELLETKCVQKIWSSHVKHLTSFPNAVSEVILNTLSKRTFYVPKIPQNSSTHHL